MGVLGWYTTSGIHEVLVKLILRYSDIIVRQRDQGNYVI